MGTLENGKKSPTEFIKKQGDIAPTTTSPSLLVDSSM